jgi:hypothetical protein
MRTTVEFRFNNARDEVNPNENNTRTNPTNFTIPVIKCPEQHLTCGEGGHLSHITKPKQLSEKGYPLAAEDRRSPKIIRMTPKYRKVGMFSKKMTFDETITRTKVRAVKG